MVSPHRAFESPDYAATMMAGSVEIIGFRLSSVTINLAAVVGD